MLKIMLVLTRKLGEGISVGDHITVRVVQIKGKQVRIGIEAPRETKIHREELRQNISQPYFKTTPYSELQSEN